jgi:hypothetical protein
MPADDSSSKDIIPILDPELLQARWVMGGIRPEDLVGHAISALQQGFAGIALQQVAGLDRPTVSDLGTLPERAFAEMGLKPLDKDGAIDLLVERGGFSANEIFRSLLIAFPAFSGRWRKHIEWWGGEPAGDCGDMSAFVHFVVDDLRATGQLGEVRRAFEFMEIRLGQSDQETRELIGWGFFETLQNVASHQPGGYAEYEQFLGSVSTRIWREIEQVWVGKSSLMDVIRAERQGG